MITMTTTNCPVKLPERIEYDLGSGIKAFSTLRSARSADEPYSGFSVCHYTGDDPAHVEACRDELCRGLGIDRRHLVVPRQTHSSEVAVVTEANLDTLNLEGIDALVTAEAGIALCINTADCVPLLMADPEAGVIAAVHAGWRGVIAGIAVKAIRVMESLGARADRINVAMGSSIGPCCFEVGEEVAAKFEETFGPDPDDIIDRSREKPHINLGIALDAQLVHAGLMPLNIALPRVCSRCRHEDFFSARRLGIASGRTLSLIVR